VSNPAAADDRSMTRSKEHRTLRHPDPLVYVVEWAAILLLLIAVEVGSLLFLDLLR
jgi:hypothetical protein